MQVAQQMSTEMQECMEECQFCHSTCTETISYCLNKGGMHAEASHIRLLMDCAQICQVAGDYMLRGSDLHGITCRACAEVCERGARDCERFGDEEQMKLCAQACRDCADSCRKMAAA